MIPTIRMAMAGEVNKKGDTASDHRRADCKNENAHAGNAKQEDPEEAPPGAKRPTSTDWDGKSKTQRRKWRRRHK